MRGIPPFIIVVVAFLGLGGLVALGGIGYFVLQAWFGVPLFATGPTQPVEFPHTVHAGAVEEGGLGLDCTFCHRNVESGAAATIPSVQQCMFCHSKVSGTTETAIAEIGKFRGLEEDGSPLATPLESLNPIDWVRVHRLPDHVQFVHDAHIRFFATEQGLETQQVCSLCHGEVENMTKVEQVRSLKMGDCVDCHREYSAPTDCAICHY